MAKAKVANSSGNTRKMRPALTPEARENQLISLAIDLAERQLRDGTASSQIVAHYLKQSTAKSQLELEKLRQENELMKAKTEAIHSQKKTEEAYAEALKAMRTYAGQGDYDDY